jgi:uncharacterized protein YndB with AHSA1/START domain
MAPIVTSIEIARPQNDVFAYVTDPSRFAEWQSGVEGGSAEGRTSPHVGAKCTTTRRVGGAARQVTSEITKIDPPTSWGIHGIDGPVRAIVDVTVEPLNGSQQCASRSSWTSRDTASVSCSCPLSCADKRATRCPRTAASSSNNSRLCPTVLLPDA